LDGNRGLLPASGYSFMMMLIDLSSDKWPTSTVGCQPLGKVQ